MARIYDGRTIDNGAAHMVVAGAGDALAAEIWLDRALGWLRAAEWAEHSGKANCLRAAEANLDCAITMIA